MTDAFEFLLYASFLPGVIIGAVAGFFAGRIGREDGRGEG